VDGKGIEKLQEAGVEVIVGILEAECQWLNRRFFTRVQKQRPYVILKWAQTNDDYFAPDDKSCVWWLVVTLIYKKKPATATAPATQFLG
jgi:diaminohydroxyphosphoribosylaminopyrimidine deaminase/5-amino-6-(5-phosphoribosylamino)uracil reductase